METSNLTNVISNHSSLNRYSNDNYTDIDASDGIKNISDAQLLKLVKEFINPKVHHWIFLTLFLVVFVVGITGNFLVCYSVWRSRSLKTVTNTFLVNLAVADFLVISICLPVTVVSDVIQSWFLGIIMCKLSVYLQRVSVFVSVLTLTFISVERYMAICHPLRHHGSYFKTKPILAAIWIVSLATPSVDFYNMILVHDSEIPESLRPWLTVCGPRDENIEMEFNMFLIVVFFLIPLVIMSYTYVKIAVCLWSSTSRHNTVSQNLQYESAIEYLQVRRRTAKMLIVVVITFGLCYLPIYVLNIVRYTNALDGLRGNRVAVLCMYWTARFLCYFNSAINPVIYNFMSVKFRKQFKTACHGCYVHLRCCCCCFKKTRRCDPGMDPHFPMKFLNDSENPASLGKVVY
ncbi:orexin/Hypocretin receptor type 1-like [Mya arenaria]|uniref:orexin/Hypocretin receptor type 1-like n=1 Tax=Mya arenaria TaxID=6604 RepID=UPI0022E3B834|nr:orexin/Hypocretin receptor type 1-like [Mya arenaria]